MRFRLAALAGLIAVSGGACSDSVGSGTNTTAPDESTSTDQVPSNAGSVAACDLVTVDDVEAVGLVVVAGPKPDEAVPGDECVFTLPQAEGSVVPGRATVWLYTAEQGSATGPDLYPGSVPLEGIGTEAWSSPNAGLAEARLSDGRVVGVQLAATGLDDSTPALVTLLTAASGRAQP